MICPNCGSNMSDKRSRCERCGTDLTIYRKVFWTSNRYYNNGLAKAKVRDLSGAVVALRKSLDLNKLNTNARNLLGLIYYEMGETVDALSEWVISRHFQPANNDANEYINKVQSNPTRLDTLSQAVKRYNTALNFAKQDNDDLAIIQLKKVVSLNPHFIRAFQLLALLHMKAGDNEKAKKYLLRAGKIDVSNTLTLRYMKEIEVPAVKDLDANPEAEQAVKNTIMPVSTYREDKPNIMAFINLVIGVVIGIALTAILIIPTVKKSGSGSDYSNSTTSEAQLQQKNNEINTLKTENTSLKNSVKDLQNQIKDSVVPADEIAAYDALSDATEKYLAQQDKYESQRDYSDIAEALAKIDDTKLESDAAVKLLKSLRDIAYPTVAKDYYNKGHNLYSQAKYDESLKVLAQAMTFDPKDVDAVYFTGRAYDRLGDKDNAKTYYNKVINDFPDSTRVAEAKSFLKLLEK